MYQKTKTLPLTLAAMAFHSYSSKTSNIKRSNEGDLYTFEFEIKGSSRVGIVDIQGDSKKKEAVKEKLAERFKLLITLGADPNLISREDYNKFIAPNEELRKTTEAYKKAESKFNEKILDPIMQKINNGEIKADGILTEVANIMETEYPNVKETMGQKVDKLQTNNSHKLSYYEQFKATIFAILFPGDSVSLTDSYAKQESIIKATKTFEKLYETLINDKEIKQFSHFDGLSRLDKGASR